MYIHVCVYVCTHVHLCIYIHTCISSCLYVRNARIVVVVKLTVLLWISIDRSHHYHDQQQCIEMWRLIAHMRTHMSARTHMHARMHTSSHDILDGLRPPNSLSWSNSINILINCCCKICDRHVSCRWKSHDNNKSSYFLTEIDHENNNIMTHCDVMSAWSIV